MSSIRFGTDGWRAIIGEDFTFASVRLVAWAVADILKAKAAQPCIVVGYDTRFASDHFAAAAAEVLTACDIRVILSDRACPSPVLSFAVTQHQADAGMMITASHNPPLFSGIKIKTSYGGAAPVDDVRAIEQAVERRAAGNALPPRLNLTVAEDRGRLERRNLVPEYHERLATLVDLEALRQAGITVMADPMFGAGGGQFPVLLSGGSSRVVEINGQPNPLFPGIRSPEPIAANLALLRKLMADSHSSIGLALDGDADRLGVVDEQGQFVNAQQVFALLTLYLLEQRQWRGPIVKSVNATTMLDVLAERFGLPVYTTPVGFTSLGPKLAEVNGLIAGEESGGFAFRGHIPERDGILAGLFLIDYMHRLGCPASGLVTHLRAQVGLYAYDRLDLTFDPSTREHLLHQARTARPSRLANRAVVDISYQDGTKFVLEDGCWLLLRFSGTEPLLRLYAEGRSDEEVEQLLQRGRDLLGLS